MELILGRRLNRALDLRLLVTAFTAAFLNAESGGAGCAWRDLVRARLLERAPAFQEPVAIGGREGRRREELEIARAIRAQSADRSERLRLWRAQTGKSEPALYRRLHELDDSSG